MFYKYFSNAVIFLVMSLSLHAGASIIAKPLPPTVGLDGPAPVAPQIPIKVTPVAPVPPIAGHSWDNKLAPPVLSNPVVFRTVSDLRLEYSNSWSPIGCAGYHYRVNESRDKDVYIDFSGQPPLKYPLLVTSARKLIIRGLAMSLEVQPGCEPGKLPNFNPIRGGLIPNANIHPRTAGGAGIMVRTMDDVWIEGVDIDVTGHNVDGILHRHTVDDHNSAAVKFKDVSIVNSRIVGWDGGTLRDEVTGDQYHADLFQTQGGVHTENCIYGEPTCIDIDVFKSFNIENLVAEHSQQGITIQRSRYDGLTIRSAFIRNYSRMPDTRYDTDDRLDHAWGLDAIDLAHYPIHIENLWYFYTNLKWLPGFQLRAEGFPGNNYVYDCDLPGNNECHPGLHYSATVPVDFAPKNQVGKHYKTPFVSY